MEEKARVALEKSINEKWIPLASGEFVGDKEPRCALCKVFREGDVDRKSLDWCKGCPVYEVTGKKDCFGTPYQDVWYKVASETMCQEGRFQLPEVVSAAKEELEFLRGLLPKSKCITYTQQDVQQLLDDRDRLWRVLSNSEADKDKWRQTANYWAGLVSETVKDLSPIKHEVLEKIWND